MAAQLARGLLLTFKGSGDQGEDSYLQQYSRVVMVKVFLVAAILCGMQGHFKDMTCHLDADSPYTDVVPQVRNSDSLFFKFCKEASSLRNFG